MRAVVIFVLLSLAAPALASRRSGLLTPGSRFKAKARSTTESKNTPGGGCSAIGSCGACTNISFCMWHKKGGCVSDSSVAASEQYNYYKGSCDHLAGDWAEVPGAESFHGQLPHEMQDKVQGISNEDDFAYKPLMMQPPAIANQDEDHIFQGAFPRPDYGMGELGYKLQGLDPNVVLNKHNGDILDSPKHGCKTPLSGCLEKPVIIPSGAVQYGEYGPGQDEGSAPSFRQAPKFDPTDKTTFTKPTWNEDYDSKNEI